MRRSFDIIRGRLFFFLFFLFIQEKVKELIGIKESDTGLSQPSQWDLVSDKQMMQEEQPLQVRKPPFTADASP